MTITRQFWVVAHRWAGLTIALFLTIAGFTGIFLAFMDDLEGVIAPELHRVEARADRSPLDPLAVRQAVLSAHPGAVINYAPLNVVPGHSMSFSLDRIDPKTGVTQPWSEDWDELFVDPYSRRTLGHRTWGAISEGRVNLMPFVYRLHYSLALGDYGMLAFGIAALIWTIDSFVGFYLTFPVRVLRKGKPVSANAAGWRQRWKPSWFVRWRSSAYKINFDLHRAGGLWIWPMLLVFSWSSVAFNLTQVYTPVMKLFGAVDTEAGIAPLAKPRTAPRLDFEAARTRGRELARTEMARLGLAVEGEDSLYHEPGAGVYAYRFTSTRDFTNEGGRSTVIFDSKSGALRKIDLPSGQNGANTFTNWIMALHMALVFGLPYRICVSLIGALVTMLSVTGVVIWTKKRSARIGRTSRLPSRHSNTVPAE